MFLDIQPTGGKRHIVSQRQVQNIKRGGIIGDKIRAMREQQHKENEVPRAEIQMDIALNNWPEKKKEDLEKKENTKKPSMWQKIQSFFIKK